MSSQTVFIEKPMAMTMAKHTLVLCNITLLVGIYLPTTCLTRFPNAQFIIHWLGLLMSIVISLRKCTYPLSRILENNFNIKLPNINNSHDPSIYRDRRCNFYQICEKTCINIVNNAVHCHLIYTYSYQMSSINQSMHVDMFPV